MERLKVVSNHVNPASSWSVATRGVAGQEAPRFANNPDDIVVVAAKRTPIGKAKRGSFKVNQFQMAFVCKKKKKMPLVNTQEFVLNDCLWTSHQ